MVWIFLPDRADGTTPDVWSSLRILQYQMGLLYLPRCLRNRLRSLGGRAKFHSAYNRASNIWAWRCWSSERNDYYFILLRIIEEAGNAVTDCFGNV